MTDFAIEHGHAEYSDAELLEQARGNAQALILATLLFLRHAGIAPERWAAAIGETFGAGWGEPRPWDAGEFLDAMLTNLRALGAVVVEVELGVERATAVTTGFPDLHLCDMLGVSPAAAAVFHQATAAIATPRGVRWSAEAGADGRTRYIVTREQGEV
ncbi:MAG: hypothetical protein U0031_18990 [Thermomicrobiales bacterium]